jgi:hypothetical protein
MAASRIDAKGDEMIVAEFWFDLTVKIAIELWFLPYKLIAGNS